MSASLRIFVPTSDSEPVNKLRSSLATDSTAIRVRVVPAPRAIEGCCYQNVREKVGRLGGRMRLGWAVWQHSVLFVEAERHAVFDPGEGKPWIDCTPNSFPDGTKCREILFIPNDGASHDFNSTIIPDNIRVPLVDDPRVKEALKLSSARIALINRVPKEWRGKKLLYHYPPELLMQITQAESRVEVLLSEALRDLTKPHGPTSTLGESVAP